MSYRLSILRSKGWSRVGLVGAAVMLPITGMQYALGLFSEGMRGVEQAAEYFAGGAAVALIIGFSAGWVLRGFAVRTRDEESGDESPQRRSGLGGGAPAAGRSPARPKG